MALHLFLLFSLLCLSSGSAISRDHSISDLDLDKFTSQEQVSSLFQLWKKEHGRVYQNQKEEAKRLEIFQRNLNYIREKNANRKSPDAHRLGLNKFADMSPEEFSKTYLRAPKELSPPINLGNNMKELKNKEDSCCANAPACWDWRKKGVVTGVKDQGQCDMTGGCGWAFASVGAMESINAIVTGNLTNLSEQELLDCFKSGPIIHFLGYIWAIENGGIATEADYPYTGQIGTCKANEVKDRVTIDNVAYLGRAISPNATDLEIETELMCAVRNQPITVVMDVTGIQFYTSGIYAGDDCTIPYENTHSLIIVGYDSVGSEDYWIVKNSWGQDWGMNGYIYISRNTGKPSGVCGLNVLAAYPVKDYPAETTVFRKGITPLFEM